MVSVGAEPVSLTTYWVPVGHDGIDIRPPRVQSPRMREPGGCSCRVTLMPPPFRTPVAHYGCDPISLPHVLSLAHFEGRWRETESTKQQVKCNGTRSVGEPGRPGRRRARLRLLGRRHRLSSFHLGGFSRRWCRHARESHSRWGWVPGTRIPGCAELLLNQGLDGQGSSLHRHADD